MGPDISGRLIRTAELVQRVGARHPWLGLVLGWLRAHWLESVALVSVVALIVAVDPVKLIAAFGRVSSRRCSRCSRSCSRSTPCAGSGGGWRCAIWG